MWSNRLTLGALGVLVIATLLSWRALITSSEETKPPPVIGTNNTALFIISSDYGLTNVHLATAHALLERHPYVKLHFASFAPMEPRIERLAAYGKGLDIQNHGIDFHRIDGLSSIAAVEALGKHTANVMHPPGLLGVAQMCRDMQIFLSPWSGEEHLAMYEQIGAIIGEVNPAVVVLDTALGPAIDATRDKNRLHAFISPNTLIENFPAEQPWGKMFWKYPALGSGIPYPVPWRRMPANIVLNIQLIATILWMPAIAEKRAFLKSKGLNDPINFFQIYRPDAPWLSQTMIGAALPVDVVPQNVTCTGPMTLSLATVAEQDKGLAEWITKSPTVLVSLGSAYQYTESHAMTMAQALAKVLGDTKVQVLWKFNKKSGDYGDEFMSALQPFVESGRARVERWLQADPPSLLDSGHIVASVHHGGSGCYHEAVGSGVPQVILPAWLDLYGFAQLSETIGVGVWGCRETSPYWTTECLYEAILRVLRSDESAAMQEKAKKLSALAQARPGRYIAAKEIAKLAGSGV